MEMQRLLLRQLDRLDLQYDKQPTLAQWNQFIGQVNKFYLDADHERYLLERSMDISSREMMNINEQLERAQYLAQICYWYYNPDNSAILWSKGIFNILQTDPLKPPPSYANFLELIHPEERKNFTQSIKKAVEKQTSFDFDIRLRIHETYQWFRMVIKPNEYDNELSGVMMNINVKKESELKIHKLHQELLSTARLAGMSEIATTILHNIGNILNSIMVSMVLIKQNASTAPYKNLSKVIELLSKNMHQLNTYLIKDPKGKLILPYLIEMAKTLEKDFQTNHEEILHLEKKILHIKEIVSMQEFFSGLSGVVEKIPIVELLESALEMSSIKGSDIILMQDIDKKIKAITSEKSKILQILTNLLRNAKEAVMANQTTLSKKINLLVKPADAGKIEIIVQDNGIGIPAENIDRIFAFGFTTKTNGHGFGLHSSGLAAKELGGSLQAQSNGINLGAQFRLILPITATRASGEFK